ncbi:spore germination protein [Paenibacillus agricola]|uniref:Spore germination protein n=1 Tax=Paenibacillus agricola TaxID=2716264 RepID=A0ABX0J517_9BACL|nr:spore germination protein [Paenibacillus agricola]NHN29201.1 spore germination protein [Paenibacillus agricola]
MNPTDPHEPDSSSGSNTPISEWLQPNIELLQSIYTDCDDVVFHMFTFGNHIHALLIYIAGLTDTEALNQQVLTPLIQDQKLKDGELLSMLKEVLPVSKSEHITTIDEIIESISMGMPVILIDGESFGLTLGLSKWEQRGVEEPVSESVIRGPREGFTETLSINMSLLRRKLRSPSFKMRTLQLGHYTHTRVVLAYIDELADDGLIEEMMARMQRINIDGILESGYIEELIRDSAASPFPQVMSTERPDIVAASLLEGRAAILVDGTPMALIAPTTLYSMLQSPEDYYQSYFLGTFIRWTRYLFLVFALLGPSMYVAVLTFHQEMLPTTLLLSISKSREDIPFPALAEALLMEITFEGLREAGLRLPKQVGAAVSIVGALVIGQAATSAGLVSAPMVMVVALTGIASFMIPHFTISIAIRLLRFPIMFLAGMLGLLGIMLGVILIVIHLCSLRSFGVPYLDSLAPMKKGEWKDVLFRAPLWSMNKRPSLTGTPNLYRQPAGKKQGPQKGGA